MKDKSSNSRVKDLARVLRPRERLAKHGAGALKDEELLAILLRTGYKGKGVLELARSILKKYSLTQILRMDFKKLSGLKGIGPTRAGIVLAARELGERSLDKEKGVPYIREPKDVINFVPELHRRKKEYFVVFYLNTRNQVLHREFISVGTLDSSVVHPREVYQPAIEKSAAGVIFIHNHPSGNPSPSSEDIKLTRRLKDAGEILGIELIDHIIIGEKDFFSLKEHKII